MPCGCTGSQQSVCDIPGLSEIIGGFGFGRQSCVVHWVESRKCRIRLDSQSLEGDFVSSY